MTRLNKTYLDEMKGIANVTGLDLRAVALYNLFYEFFTVCTSIVAQTKDGDIFAGRNLDFGILLGWNNTKGTWSMTDALRATGIQLDWKKGGKTIFKTTQFVGYVGALTGMKPVRIPGLS